MVLLANADLLKFAQPGRPSRMQREHFPLLLAPCPQNEKLVDGPSRQRRSISPTFIIVVRRTSRENSLIRKVKKHLTLGNAARSRSTACESMDEAGRQPDAGVLAARRYGWSRTMATTSLFGGEG